MDPAITLDDASKYMPFLLEVRRRVLFLVSLFVVSSILGFIYYERIIRLILSVFKFDGINIVFTSPFQYINLAINSSLLVGVVVVFPLVTLQLLSFLKPALHPREYRALIVLFPVGVVLFLLGFTYGILMMKYTIELFYQQTQDLGVGNFIDINEFFSQTLMTATLLGIAFLFPLVLTFLMRFNLLKHRALARQRPFVYLICLVFVVLLPANDILSDLLLFLPLVFLFELTLILNRIIFKTTNRKEDKNV